MRSQQDEDRGKLQVPSLQVPVNYFIDQRLVTPALVPGQCDLENEVQQPVLSYMCAKW